MNEKTKSSCQQKEVIKQLLKILPRKSGVYIFKSFQDKIIYIGKAKNIHNRVKSYFHSRNDNFLYMKPSNFTKQIKSIDYMVTDNEVEALILESNLIKKNKPKYNIDLKDDKSYPFIAVTDNEKFPRVFLTRNRNIKDAKYFGPYTCAGSARKTLEYLRRVFQIRDCRKTKPGKSSRNPCLNYYIKLCSAPCTGNISEKEYRKNIDFIKLFLKGKDKDIINEIKIKMEEYSRKEDFEKAAELKSKMEDINKLSENQKVFFDSESAWDFISPARGTDKEIISLFSYRAGMLAIINNFTIGMDNTRYLKDEEILLGFIKKYYADINNIPSMIYIPFKIEDTELISKWLTEKKNKKVEIKIPKIGKKKKIMEMAIRNSKLYMEKKKFEQDTGSSKVYKDFE